MAYTRYRGKRVSKPHAAMFRAYERKFGVPVQLNQGARTLAEQTGFYVHYLRFGHPVAAKPLLGAPHIKFRRDEHANDINSGSGKGEAGHVAAFYKSHGVPVVFNVRNEPWHMDTLSGPKLRAAAKKLAGPPVLRRGARGNNVVRLKKLLYRKGVRNFSGKASSNRYWPVFNQYTKAAVARFQKSHGLKADGVVGAATWKALEK